MDTLEMINELQKVHDAMLISKALNEGLAELLVKHLAPIRDDPNKMLMATGCLCRAFAVANHLSGVSHELIVQMGTQSIELALELERDKGKTENDS